MIFVASSRSTFPTTTTSLLG